MGLLQLPSEDWASVARRMARDPGPIAWGWMAHRSSDDHWNLAVLTIRGVTPVQPVALDYGDIRFGLESITPAAAARRFRAGRSAPRWRGAGGLPVEPIRGMVSGQWITTAPTFGPPALFADPTWPQYLLSTGLGTTSLPVYGGTPLSGPNQPFFPTVAAALGELLYDAPGTELERFSHPHLVVRLPDRRARFAELRIDEGRVVVGVDVAAANGGEFTVRTAWRTDHGSYAWSRRDHPVSETTEAGFETGGVPVEFSAILVDSTNRILDTRGWDDRFGPPSDQPTSLHARVLAWLGQGEGQQIEFKQKLGEAKTNTSFAETVAAFANGPGGVILVGVADDATLVGWDPPSSADRITDIVRARVREPVEPRIEKVVLDDTPITVVIVPGGDLSAKPYRCDERVMIRTGATTRVAQTWEIRQLAAEPTPASASPLWRPRR